MPAISQSIKKLIVGYQLWHKASQTKDGVPLIHIDEVAGKVASFYEKMRGIIDWREEHLLRKTAIERILKRRLFLKKDGKEISEPFVHELIRGGHFPNDAIPESKITEIQKLIDKYLYILDNAGQPPKGVKQPQLHDWLWGIAACEIEGTLTPATRETALIEFMFELMKDKIQVGKISDEEKNIQVYIAIQKALFKLDEPLISYNLFKKWYHDWADLSDEKLEQIAKNIYLLWDKMEKNIRNSLSDKFYAVCERYDTAYLILGDIISAQPMEMESILSKPEILENKIKSAYKERLKKVKSRLRRAAFYSTLSIFLSKILIALAIEVPFDKYIAGEFIYSNIWLSVFAPPLLMAFLVMSIRPPSKQNEQLVVMEIMKLAYESEKRDVHTVRPAPKRGFILNAVIVLIYLLSFVASFGLIIWGLRKLDFSAISILIFLAFTSLISFAGIKIRQRAQELKMEKEKDSLLHTFVDIFSLPIIQVGRWLSNQWHKYNAIAVLFNSLLDMPFLVFVEFLEQWRLFLKEKKEKIH